MFNFFIGYCSGHSIFPVFLNPFVIRIDFTFGPKERLYTVDMSNKNRFFLCTSVPFI